MIKVFIDQFPIQIQSGHTIRGIGTYTRNLVEALVRQKEVKIVSEKSLANIIHYPYFDLFFNTLKINQREKAVVTVFDTIPLIYPKYYPVGIKGKINFFRQKKELKKAKAVITISETSKKDIVRFLDIPNEKIFSIHLAPGKNFRKLRLAEKTKIAKLYSLPKRFVLYVGDVNYNKNVDGLIKAFSLLLDKDIRLVLVGKAFTSDIPETRKIIHLIEELGIKHRIKILGFIPEEDLVGVYNLATVYCQPSFYEGFGLPVLEAVACGTPVVAAKTQALVEIAEGAALFVDPYNVQDIASGLDEIMKNKKTTQVKNFSWERVANETIQVYKRVLT